MTSLRAIKAFDGVSIAAHELLKASPGASNRVIFSHATGFHGLMFHQTMKVLSFHCFDCLAIDHRGHGLTKYVNNSNGKDSWEMFGDDVLAASSDFMKDADELGVKNPLIGVGHSMGATALLIAALKNPTQFKALLLYEPIIFPPHWVQQYSPGVDSPLAVLSRKRRNLFPSYSGALDNFASKMPFSAFESSVLRDYVSLGLVPSKDKDMDVLASLTMTDGDNDGHEERSKRNWRIDDTIDEELCLRCTPDFEAFVYNSVSDYYIYDKLASLTNIPIIVMSGASVKNQPSSLAEDISSRITNSSLVRWEDAGHFGPFEYPFRFADAIRSLSTSL